MKIISWNVNSLRAREPLLEKIVKSEAPDIICLQELKILDKEYVENFFNQFSLKTVAETQKSYNGVSVSYKREIALSENPLKKLNMTQARNNTVIIKDKNLDVVFASRLKNINSLKEILKELIKKPSYLATILCTFLINKFSQTAH